MQCGSQRKNRDCFRNFAKQTHKREAAKGNFGDKETANKYLFEEYIPEYNRKYGKAPAKKGNFHRDISFGEKELLPSILSEHHTRMVQNNFCISYKNRVFQLSEKQPATVRKRERVVIEERMDASIWIKLRGKYLNYQETTEEKRSPVSEKDVPWIVPAKQKGKSSLKHVSEHLKKKSLAQ